MQKSARTQLLVKVSFVGDAKLRLQVLNHFFKNKSIMNLLNRIKNEIKITQIDSDKINKKIMFALI